MTQVGYSGRGIHNGKLLKSLITGELKAMLDVVNQDEELDVQIRCDYLNIYYRGGNIAKVNSAKSLSFDKNYFGKNEGAKGEGKHSNLISEFKKGNFKKYFECAKAAMSVWLVKHPKPEREQQHQLSIQNKYGSSDYCILDIEYQVSKKSAMYSSSHRESKEKPKRPRFDIIAVHKSGKLCVIELKKGSRALGGASGIAAHLDGYTKTIGKNPSPFLMEMRKLLEQKQELGIIDRRLKITSDMPEFILAYAFTDEDQERERKSFERHYSKLPTKPHTIWLSKGIFELKN